MLQKKKIISINVSIGTYKDFIEEIFFLSKRGISSYICVANVHMLIEAYDDKHFREIVNNAVIVTPDGMPLVKALKYFYGIKQQRVAGMDLFPDLLREAQNRNLKIFLYGSTEKILEKISKKAKKLFPNLKIIGTFSPPFRPLKEIEKLKIIKMINTLNPDIVFVSLGCPKQERWMAEMSKEINSLMIGVGAAFLTFAGIKKRAPKWMQKTSLEWLYRLYTDPKRLFKRYAYTNTKFIYLFIKELIKIKLKGVNQCLKKH